ncbi:MAG: DinB family protein [Vicinamibacterales bacterium]
MQFDHAQRVTAAAEAAEIATATYLAFLDAMPERETMRPLAGGWTPAQHAGHLALTADVFRGAILGGPACCGVEPFAGSSDFPDEAWSMDTPPPAVAPPIIVAPSTITRREASAHLRQAIAELSPAIRAMTLDRGRMAVQLPWAVVSVYQMAEWASGHTIRHITQVNRERQQGIMRSVTV